MTVPTGSPNVPVPSSSDPSPLRRSVAFVLALTALVAAVSLVRSEPPGQRAEPARAAPPVEYLFTVAPPPPPPPTTTTTVHVHTPRRRGTGNSCGDMETCLARIAQCESGGRYDAQNLHSTASGKYQALNGTWDGYAGYERARDAPPEVQEAWAREAWAAAGGRPWRKSQHCWSQ